MHIRVLEGYIHLTRLHTRMPFRYGIATLTEMPHAFFSLVAEIDGALVRGTAADSLPPKWFTKNPDATFASEIAAMLEVMQKALQLAVGSRGESVFTLWWDWQAAMAAWGKSMGLAPLLTQFGVSLAERALIDALARARGCCFFDLVRTNALGIRLDDMHPSLRGVSMQELLGEKPLSAIQARHTIGLSDPLRDRDIPAKEKLEDGLPQSLESCIQTYGLRHFKIKLSGQAERDADRLHQLADILRPLAGPELVLTLDGNEQFHDMGTFRESWEQLACDPWLQVLFAHALFVEQPVHRDHALAEEVRTALDRWTDHPPLLIDESDAALESYPRALALGYVGTSHKNCKGVIKSLAHACWQSHQRHENPGARHLLSGEDLCNVGPVALQQDLAAAASLGITSVERNGHHYNAGLSQFPETVRQLALAQHPDLYRASAAGWPTVRIEAGRINLASVNAAPFGVQFAVPLEQFQPLARWSW